MPIARLEPRATSLSPLCGRSDEETIYFARPSAQYQAYRSEIDEAIQRVLEGHSYILGPEVEGFEREFSAFTGARHAIGVANGTDAIHLALRACRIGPGDEVITTPHTAIATVAAVAMSGARVVFADICDSAYGLDPESVARAVTSRTKAILPVHLYGHPVAMGPLLELAARHGLRLIEDCAQAHAALWHDRQVGTLGHIGCFSLYPTKNLGALGDAGIVITSDDSLAEQVRLLRQYGWLDRQVSHIPGFNSRLDELQAAVLRVKLRHLDDNTARRRAIAARYIEALEDLPLVLPCEQADCASAYHLFVIRSPQRNALKEYLGERGIVAGIHYPLPAHKHPAYAKTYADLRLPVAEGVVEQVLSLPIYPELTNRQIERVIAAMRDFFRS